jgi:ACS family hexuronate transporter-like MFS transporter
MTEPTPATEQTHTNAASAAGLSYADPRPPHSAYRWTICGLLFAATTINYMDRQILGILADTLQKEIGWSEAQYSYIVMAFQAAYAIGLASFGWLIDRWGTKAGYTIAIFIWSIAAAAHAAARSVFGFGAARFALGIGEAGNFPAAIKSVAEWFPKRERALATGMFNAGSNAGAIFAPALVPWMAITFGWRASFVALGVTGLLWIVAWLILYDPPSHSRRVSQAELDHIQSDGAELIPSSAVAKVPWSNLFGYRQTWAYVIPSSFVSPVWWFYLYWLPKFFSSQYNINLSHLGLPLVIVYSMSMVGSVGGGWLSSVLLAMGWSPNWARKVALLAAALCVAPVTLITFTGNLWIATFLAGMATLGHQAMSANMYTMVSDLFPKRAVASVVGLGSAAGSAVALVFSWFAGQQLQHYHSYTPMFVIAGIGYPLTWVFLHLMAPQWEPVQISDSRGFEPIVK